MKQRSLIAAAALFAAACSHSGDKSPEATPAAPPPAPVAQVAPPAPPAAPAVTAPAAAGPRTDFGDMANWLCRPGKTDDACKVDLTTTVVQANGATTIEPFSPGANPPIDCFYVYPTVSLDAGTYSDLVPGPEELSVVRAQLARLGSKCRLFAPMYRQFSLGALRARMSGGAAVPANGSPLDGANDVDDAWAWYLANENKGRGVVILGHSQGSGQITRLIASKIDGKPEQDRLISAVVMGSTIQVPVGKDVGGTFKSIPVCRKADQFGCVLSWSTYRTNVPPAPTANFGRARGEGFEAVCTNPAALGGGEAKSPKAYFSSADREWVKGKKAATPFVATPGLISTECVKTPTHHYLEMRIHADPADARIDDPGTDVMAKGAPDPNWGLHLVDANVGMGDLVDLVGKQGDSWRAAHK